jgi:hypothetical protein
MSDEENLLIPKFQDIVFRGKKALLLIDEESTNFDLDGEIAQKVASMRRHGYCYLLVLTHRDINNLRPTIRFRLNEQINCFVGNVWNSTAASELKGREIKRRVDHVMVVQDKNNSQ